MDEAAAEEGGAPIRGRHIKKRALRNKSLSVTFDEKNLKDFVSGFHKRKKKRRREALQQQAEAARRKRIELRKKRKMERDFAIYGGAAPDSGTGGAEPETDEEQEHDGDMEPVASVSGTTVYDNDDLQVVVTTSEITREEAFPADTSLVGKGVSTEGSEKSKLKAPVSKKKQLKKAPKKRSHPRPQGKRDRRKGKIKKTKY